MRIIFLWKYDLYSIWSHTCQFITVTRLGGLIVCILWLNSYLNSNKFTSLIQIHTIFFPWKQGWLIIAWSFLLFWKENSFSCIKKIRFYSWCDCGILVTNFLFCFLGYKKFAQWKSQDTEGEWECTQQAAYKSKILKHLNFSSFLYVLTFRLLVIHPLRVFVAKCCCFSLSLLGFSC